MDSKYILRSEGLLVVDRGAWLSGEDYDAGNLVQDSGSYICTVPHTASAATEPGIGASWSTVWRALQTVTGTYQSSYFKAQDTIPYYRLVDGSANDVAMRLDAGLLKFYDNLNSRLMMSLDSATLAASIAGALSVVGSLSVDTEKTDHQLGLDLSRGIGTVHGNGAIGGTWTVSEGASDNLQIVTRSVAQADHDFRINVIGLPKRSATGKGAKIKSVTLSYVVGSADTANDILQLQILRQVVPADGVAASASILAGDDDADYDAGHNTNALRLATGSHTVTVSIPSGEQEYATSGQNYAIRVRIKDTTTANLTFVLTGCYISYAAAEY